MLVTEIYDNIKFFEVRLPLWGNQLKRNDFVHIQHSKYLDAT